MKSNGSFTSAMESSLLLKLRTVPPLPLLASMKLKFRSAKFVLVGAAVTVNVGPVAVWPKRETVIGPVVAPNGTIAVITFRLALITRADMPLKATSIFCVRFDSRTQNIDVAFNGMSARVISASLNVITAIVPFGATTGPITVSLFGQTATGPTFTVTAAPTSTNFAERNFNFIDASSGNGGTVLSFSNNDDSIALVKLPFDFILFRDIYIADS